MTNFKLISSLYFTGNLSYADLITKAIQSTAEKRLTLAQIYDWMVQNVSYFRDKGDSNSSAGWKVCTITVDGVALEACYSLLTNSVISFATGKVIVY